ncbi:flagellar biosynthesis protein FlhB [Curtobacterium sp. MCBD17_019]|uniref:EscU/YscU/HrcU family type III secretion system export apparatus switch protein n=1 Tax=Curtobacterium sp. MCBD17_019 TaxID=2175669 RepID=UPI000DA8FD2C|nr:EscU/YscU/HrcU family type III secretion system export apparatus switch protein [Curtobacterium sp. MCBD17_019]PZE75823.1 type III secretion protein [Curtobacterium sp. MCBD17_019]
MSDTGERTEQATEKRMKEVHRKGQLSRSTDLSAWLGVAAAAVMVPSTIASAAAAGTDQVFRIERVIAHPTVGAVRETMAADLGSIGSTLAPMLGVVAVVVAATAIAQGGVHIKRMTGNYEQFNLLTGITRVFGTQALWGGAKALLKSAVVGLVLWEAVQGLVPVLMSSGSLPLTAVLQAAGNGAATLLRAAIAAGLLLAAVDVFVVMRRNRKKTRMTKKEVKDEHKSTDGDPHVKSHRRSRQLAMSRNRMIGAIATADVVLTNPTHFAVAIRYEPGKSAPKVVAKGAGAVAEVIRDRAEADRVPIVRDVPLTRALHAACEIGTEIPVDLYTPVARVLSFVMALRARGAATGVHSAPRPTTADEVATVIAADQLAGDALPRRIRHARTTEGAPA